MRRMSGHDGYGVVVSAGSLRPEVQNGVVMPHRWTTGGVTIEADFTGGHLYHLATAGCLLNDMYREAQRLGIELDGVRVRARGGFDSATWTSTGVEYEIDVASDAPSEEVEQLLRIVDDVAEIPKVLRSSTTVTRNISR
jgi:uncharacterized OsmC-like protein